MHDRSGDPADVRANDIVDLLQDGQKSVMDQLWVAPAVAVAAFVFMNVEAWYTSHGHSYLPWQVDLVFAALALTGLVEILTRMRVSSTSREAFKEDRARKSLVDNATAEGRHADLVIACSGGGIKSASFCLGALQLLDERGAYTKASHLVAVSGGGYAATAFSLAKADSRGRFLAPDSPQLACLRKRTNYLTDSPRTTFQFVASLLLGSLYGLIGTAFILFIIASVVGTYTRVRGASMPYAVTLAPAVLAVAVAAGVFLVDRFRRGPGAAPSLLSGRYSFQQHLVFWAFVWVVAVPGLMLTSEHDMGLHNAPQIFHVFADEWAEKLAAAVASLTALVALIRSAVKGSKVTETSGPWSAVLAYFRRWVAPVLALAILALVFYGFASSVALRWSQSAEPWTLWLPIVVLGAYLVGRHLGNANRWTMHMFYRDRLEWAYLESALYDPEDPRGTRRRSRRKEQSPSFWDLDAGRPELVLCATATVLDVDRVPTGRGGAPFVLSKPRMGLTDSRLPGGGCLMPADEFSVFWRQPTSLASAMAISGAAVAPIAGRDTRTVAPYRVLLAFCNVRLGVWMRNPYWLAADKARDDGSWYDLVRSVLEVPAPGRRFVAEAFGRPPLGAPLLYLTDGGHYDNLGLVEALRLKPTRIIMLDGSGDARDTFSTMGRAIATARIDLGVEIELDPGPLRRGSKSYTDSGVATALATWPDRTTCWIYYVKSVLPKGLSWDVESYRTAHPDFPETSEQLERYDEFDFEAFRQLGYSIAKEIPPNALRA